MATSANSTKVRLRQLWFQVHKWIGLILAPVVIVICLTGSALVWHDWVDEALNPERSVAAAPSRDAAFYAEAARAVLEPGQSLQGLRFPAGDGAVVATAGAPVEPGSRPLSTRYFLHPEDGRLLDRAAGNEGAVHVMHVLHGSLYIPGWGRPIVGWIGVAMLISSLTGLWLWWPFKGGFTRGLRWKRMPTTSGNLHHQGGLWIAIPLAILSFTGAWISFPAFFGQFESGPPGPSRAEIFRRMGAPVLVAPALTPDGAREAAATVAGGNLVSIDWPREGDNPAWTVTFAGVGGVSVDDVTAEATPPSPPPPETTARLMRRIHDGTDTGLVWQIIVFLGGLVPTVLAVTGIMMWQRGRRVKGSVRAAYAAERARADG